MNKYNTITSFWKNIIYQKIQENPCTFFYNRLLAIHKPKKFCWDHGFGKARYINNCTIKYFGLVPLLLFVAHETLFNESVSCATNRSDSEEQRFPSLMLHFFIKVLLCQQAKIYTPKGAGREPGIKFYVALFCCKHSHVIITAVGAKAAGRVTNYPNKNIPVTNWQPG